MPDGPDDKRPLPPGGRTTRDQMGHLRDWFHPGAPALVGGDFAPDDVARRVLVQNAAEFGWKPTLSDMRPAATLKTPGAFSVRFTQEHHGLPVDGTEVVVNVYADSRVHSIYNQYRYRIPAGLTPAAARLDAVRAREIVARLTAMFRRREIGPARLIVYPYRRHDLRPSPRRERPRRARAVFARRVQARLARPPRPREGTYLLVWELIVASRQPFGRWRILVDAVSGRLVDVLDLVAYAVGGTGRVFDPNPIVTSGDASLSSATPTAILDRQRRSVRLARLDPAGPGGRYRLDGTWAHMEEYSAPTHIEPTSKTRSFSYSWKNRKFLDVMAYFHVDRFQQYLRTTLGLGSIAAFSVPVDAHGMEGLDASGSDGHSITFGEGGVPDASDAMLILHEYGHVIQEATQQGSATGGHGIGFSEGFPDFLAAVFYDDRHANPAQTRGKMFSWNANPTDHVRPPRTYDHATRFDGPEWADLVATGSAYQRAAVWCSVMFELYRKLGGDAADPATKAAARDLVIRLHLVANAHVPAQEPTLAQLADQLETADTTLDGWRPANGLHVKVIRDTFARRGTPGHPLPAIDVYVFDGREGGYGTADGLDAFGAVLWKADFEDTPDVWTTAVPAADAARTPPRVGQQAHLWTRVKNRGTVAAGPVTVRAFRATAAAMIWPTDWVVLDAAHPSRAVADVAPLPAPGVVVGPFTWVPAAAGRVRVLVVVECAADQALTETLPAAARVRAMDLVPFDNNIVLRRLSVRR
jgi:zinc metalloprotease ZmpB